jgi:hypothetical protein
MSDADGIPRGLKIIIGFHIVSFLLWVFGQTGALVAYDTVADWGFQDPRARIDPVIVEVNKGIGLADTLVMLPLFVVAVFGLLRRRFFGAVASWLVFGMTLYWPIVFWSSQHFYGQAAVKHQPTPAAGILVPAALMIIALWGSWYLARSRRQFR